MKLLFTLIITLSSDTMGMIFIIFNVLHVYI